MTLKMMLSCLALAPMIFSAATVAAQPPAPAGAQTQAEKKLERQGLALLEEVIAEARTLKLVDNRIRVQAKAAELLWPRDEKRARALFREAMDTLSALLSNPDPDDDPRAHQFAQARTQLRQEMLQMVAQRDPKLAREFLRATRQPWAGPSYPHQPDPELQLELSLSALIAASDPKEALKIAAESLTKGFDHQLGSIVVELSRRDREAAAKLAHQILSKLRAENLIANQAAAGVAFGLLTLAAQEAQEAEVGDPTNGNAARHKPVLNEAQVRELIELLASAALGDGRRGALEEQERHMEHNLLTWMQGHLPQIEKYSPAHAAALRGKTAELNRTQDARTRAWQDFNQLLQQEQATIVTLLEAAAKALPELRPQMYQQTAWKAFNEGNAEQARQIISEQVTDPAQRQWMLADLDRQLVWRKANEGKLEEARRLLPHLRRVEERAEMLTELAATAAGKGNQKLALQLLAEARAQIGARMEHYPQLHALLQLANAYAALDPAQSFELLEPVTEQLTQVIAAAAVIDGFEQRGAFREGELILQNGSLMANLVQQYAQSLSALARADFDRAKDTAHRFQRTETRVFARLTLAQGALPDSSPRDNQGGRGSGFGVSRGRGLIPLIRH